MKKGKIRTTLKDGEHIIHKARKHIIVLFIPMLIVTAVFYISFAAPASIDKSIKPIAPYAISLSLMYFLYAFFDRITNIFVVTNYRVIREWGIVSYNVMENSLDKIHNVGVKQDVLGIIFGYGSLVIQTAVETGDKAENFIASPRKFQSAVFKAQEGINKKAIEGEDTTMECPYCAEIIKAKAKICRFCGKDVKVEPIQEVKDVKVEPIQETEDTKETVEVNNSKIRGPREFLRCGQHIG